MTGEDVNENLMMGSSPTTQDNTHYYTQLFIPRWPSIIEII